jgi:hypothetical protein
MVVREREKIVAEDSGLRNQSPSKGGDINLIPACDENRREKMNHALHTNNHEERERVFSVI